MPFTYSPEQRAVAIDKVLKGLRSGVPLAVLCNDDGMPCDDTVRIWADGDEELARAIARARETGWDMIAVEALGIADDNSKDTVETEHGPRANSEWISRSKLRVDTRLKLLAKWDPKRYGERLTHAGDPDAPVQVHTITRRIIDPKAE